MISKKKAPKYSETSQTNTDPLRKPDVYLEFVNWICLPDREPKTQQQFAKKFGVSMDTLTDWKKRAGFWKQAETSLNIAYLREKTTAGLMSMYEKRIMKYGDPKAMALWLSYVNKFNPKVHIMDDTPLDKKFDADTLSELTNALKKAGFEGVTSKHEELVKVFNASFANVEDTSEDEDRQVSF